MSNPDRLLADLWAVDQPAERDPVFVLAVMAEVERRRFWLSLASLVPVAVAASAVLWALSPLIQSGAERWLTFVEQPAVAACAAAAVVTVWLWSAVSGRPALIDA